MNRIVGGVDGSEDSIQAVAFAARGETGADLMVVFVEQPPLVGRPELERSHHIAERRVARRVVKALMPLAVPWNLKSPTGDVPRRSSGWRKNAAPT